MKGVAGWITTNVTDKLAAALTEADLLQAMEDVWVAGGNADCVFVGAHNKGVISGFTVGNTKNVAASDKRLVGAVDVYEGDFGVYKIVPDRFQLADDVYVLDSSLWAAAVLRPFKLETLAKTGDAEKRQLIGECTLISRQEAGSAAVINTATA